MSKHVITPDSIAAAKALVCRLCENGHVRMSVPVDFARDEDMLICALIEVAEKSLAIPAASRAATLPEGLYEVLHLAECALADIGDADREPGDDVAWCEARAAQALPAVRGMLKSLAALEAAQPASPAPLTITDTMVDAYLMAQRRTVEDADRFGRPNVGGLHTNTVREACRAGLSAAALASPQPATLTEAQQRVSEFAAAYAKRRGLDPEQVYSLGTADEPLVLRLSDLVALASPQVAPAPEPESMLKEVEAALVFALWHHQGGSSKVGQPIRKMLGIGPHMRLNAGQIEQAKRVQAAFDVANYGSAAPVQVAPAPERECGDGCKGCDACTDHEGNEQAPAKAGKFDHLAGRGMHELRFDELTDYVSSIAGNPTAQREAVSWIVSELERKTDDERVLAVKLDAFRQAAADDARDAARLQAPPTKAGHVVFRIYRHAPDVEWAAGVDLRDGAALYLDAPTQPAVPSSVMPALEEALDFLESWKDLSGGPVYRQVAGAIRDLSILAAEPPEPTQGEQSQD